MEAYNVYLRKRLIDTVFQDSPYKTRAERERDVYNSLVNHDGYNSEIKVKECL